jgi:hypothetical protein
VVLAAGGRRRREKRREKRKEGKGKRKGEKEKEKKGKEGKEKKNRKERKRNWEKFRKLGKIVRKIGGRVFAGFYDFPGVGVIYGTAVMARRTGRQGPRCARDSRHGG